jgi:hypothetical protein
LRALSPLHAEPADSQIEGLLRADSNAVRSILDRLSIKLRIPGYQLLSRDLEDSCLRASLLAVLRGLQTASPGDLSCGGLHARIGRADLHAAVEMLASSPVGSCTGLIVRTALMPTEFEACGELAHSLNAYRSAIRATLETFEGLSPDEFRSRLVGPAISGLDAARADVLETLKRIE